MKIKILQKIADSIINRLEKSENEDIFQFYYELGVSFNYICVNNFGVYLN